jgi:hypothetical protein
MLPRRDRCRRVFVSKGYLPQLYKWSPGCETYNPLEGNVDKVKIINPSFCDATPGSQGQDWINTYVYNISMLNYERQRLAYVACDYVE